MPLTRHQIALLGGCKNFRVNDKVMQIRNNYEKEVFNGDLGRMPEKG
jgi:exodeoxyribonuclease V alpha subunit